MAFTFDQGAREAVWREVGPTWDTGTFVVLEDGYEDDWLVIAGAREALVDGDPEYVVMDVPALFVSKTTGQVERAVVLDNMARIDAMERVNNALVNGTGEIT